MLTNSLPTTDILHRNYLELITEPMRPESNKHFWSCPTVLNSIRNVTLESRRLLGFQIQQDTDLSFRLFSVSLIHPTFLTGPYRTVILSITSTRLFFCVTIRSSAILSPSSNTFTKTDRLTPTSYYHLSLHSLRRLQTLHGNYAIAISKTGNSLSVLPNHRSKIIERITKMQTFPGLVVSTASISANL